MEKLYLWGVQKFKSNFIFFITVLGVIILSVILNHLFEYNFEYCILFLGYTLLFILGLIFVWYVYEFNKDYEIYKLSQRVPVDTSMELYHAKLTFDKDSLSDFGVVSETVRVLRNRMIDNRYNLFTVKVSSSKDVPKIEDIKVIKDGKTLNIDRESSKAKLVYGYHASEVETCESLKDAKICNKSKEFIIPLHIDPGKSSKFRIIYRSFAFSEAIKGRKDYQQILINRIVDEFVISINLQDPLKDTHEISKCSEHGDDGNQYIFQIFDGSNERMLLAEQDLEKQGMVPSYEGDKVIWRVRNPKISYNYRLYFRIIRK